MTCPKGPALIALMIALAAQPYPTTPTRNFFIADLLDGAPVDRLLSLAGFSGLASKGSAGAARFSGGRGTLPKNPATPGTEPYGVPSVRPKEFSRTQAIGVPATVWENVDSVVPIAKHLERTSPIQALYGCNALSEGNGNA